MMSIEKITVKYRAWHKGIPPRPIKLQIPGWAGEVNHHADGDTPQPWHCQPFIDGSTYGLELIYPFDTECRVYLKEQQLVFEGDWEKEKPSLVNTPCPPFQIFAPGHFGFTSSLDIQAPPGHIVRLEPHPRFYTDDTHSCPIAVPGHIQSEWWPKIFFVVFKSPMPGQTYIFRKNEPYAQILILPRRINYDITEMNPVEQNERIRLEEKITKYAKYFVSNRWTDHTGHSFDDKYRQLSTAFAKDGWQGIETLLAEAIQQETTQKHQREEQNRSRFGRRIVKRSDESL